MGKWTFYVTFSIVLLLCLSANATYYPKDYVMTFSGVGCLMGPNEVGPHDYSAYGIVNENTDYDEWIYCSLTYLHKLQVESDTQEYNPKTDPSYLYIDVYDNNDKDSVDCRLYTSDGGDNEPNFYYESSSWYSTDVAATDAETLTIDLDADLGSYDKYMGLACVLPDKETYVSRLLGYRIVFRIT